jgi:cis-L-3-hydroxyproline dehydratase
MFHIPGITVGSKTIMDAFGGNKPVDEIDVSNRELEVTRDSLQTGSNRVDTVILGCPHYNLDQIRKVASLLRGRKLRNDVTFWVNTSATTKILAERAGLVRDIEETRARVIVDTCIDMFCWNNLRGKTGMTDSPKCAYYRRFGDVRVGSVEECVANASV